MAKSRSLFNSKYIKSLDLTNEQLVNQIKKVDRDIYKTYCEDVTRLVRYITQMAQQEVYTFYVPRIKRLLKAPPSTATNEYWWIVKFGKKGRRLFNEFNMSRSITLENCIKRYGEEEGTKRFESYCMKQKDAGIALNYFIEKLGEEEGTKKFFEVSKSKAHNIENYKKRYGDEAEERLKTFFANISASKFTSDIAVSFCKHIHSVLPDVKMYYNGSGKELVLYDKSLQKTWMYDLYIPEYKIVIEFHGDWWHGNPEKYRPNDTIGGGIKAHVKWERDEYKKQFAISHGMDYICVWEKDWSENSDTITKRIVEYVTNKCV